MVAQLYNDRWFPWAIIVAVIVTILLVWQIQLYSLEVEQSAYEMPVVTAF